MVLSAKAVKKRINSATARMRGDDQRRYHMGCSIIGHACSRFIWNETRWVLPDQGEQSKRTSITDTRGRMHRLFNRGHEEERRVARWLRAAGCKVWRHDPDGNQFCASLYYGHIGGSTDMFACGFGAKKIFGVEVKTHSHSAFNQLAKHGVEKAFFTYYVQANLYAHAFGRTRYLYVGVNKNNDDLYIEWIRPNKKLISTYMQRAKILLRANDPPKRISNRATWYQCKMCRYHSVCHGGAQPAANCRTCCYSRPVLAASNNDRPLWHCAKNRPEIVTASEQGCGEYDVIDGVAVNNND